MRRRLYYPVVTFVMVMLAAFALLQKLVQPYVPVGAANAMASEQAEFLRQGGYELIEWHRPTAEAFALARSKERPILLLLGAAWSEVGRRLDRDVLSSERVQRLLDTNFICIRADAEDQPDWLGAFLPVSRAVSGGLPELQLIMLDPSGRFLTSLHAGALGDNPNVTDFIAAVSTGLSRLESYQRNPSPDSGGTNGPGYAQANDLKAINEAPTDATPDFRLLRQALSEAALADGGYPVKGSQPLWPEAWTFLLATSGPTALGGTFGRLFLSPVTDPLDGGFYLGSTTPDWRGQVFDKSATSNAEMALLLARCFSETQDEIYRVLARRALDLIFRRDTDGGLCDASGFIRACRIGEEVPPFSRSPRSSFSPRRLRELFPDSQLRDYVTSSLRLDPRQNEQVSPALKRLDDWRSMPSALSGALETMRNASPVSRVSSQVTLAVQGTVSARAIEAARILGDGERLDRATSLYEKLSAFNQGPDVIHLLADPGRVDPTLADYLAYSDACLQDFLNLGRIPSLEQGLSLLERAMAKFGTDRLGLFNQALPKSAHVSAPSSNVPQIADDFYESNAARMIRLSWSYGQLLAMAPDAARRKSGQHLLKVANDGVAAFASVASLMGAFAGGYDLAAALAADGQVVYAVGPNPAGLAAKLAQLSPLRLVAPAAGPVRPDLQARPVGYYITIQGKTAGPFSLEKAASLLSPQLVVGP
jgi:uncharacterized protein YyaL (SSP411 family)